MTKRLLVESRPMDTRIALMEDDRLSEMMIERRGSDTLTGSIFLGRVETMLPGMHAAFINIGLEKNAFLSLADYKPGKGMPKSIRPGQELPVQIVKIPGGEKGHRVSTEITLAGKMCVLLPTVDEPAGISKKIESREERERLYRIAASVKPEGMGLIVRTAAEGASAEELKRDIAALVGTWREIEKRAYTVKAPRTLYTDSNAIFRAVRDHLTEDVDEMLFESGDDLEKGMNAARMLSPSLLPKLRLSEGEVSLFSRFRVNDQLEKALSRRVWLKSGGFLIFDKTEALTVIDVNTGKFTGKASLSETILKTNLEAAEEIACQLRLRDIGGIIIIDFIDMETDEQKNMLLEALKNALERDRTHINLAGLTSLGLVELTRKKRREPLESYFKISCPVCAGGGFVTNPESVAFDAIGEAYAKCRRDPGGIYLIHAHARVCERLISLPIDPEARIYVLPDEKIASHEYKITKVFDNELTPKCKRIGGDES